jgi:hypothetical protein
VTEIRDGLTFIEARELPYLSQVPRDRRTIPITPYYDADAKCFYVYIKQPNGMILVLGPAGCIEGTYLAKGPANEDVDRRLPFLETMMQHFSFADVLYAVMDAAQDLINGLSSLHKYFVLLNYANDKNDFSGPAMIRSEVECAFANHRSFYDCLQRIIRALNRRYRPGGHDLPDSFAKIEQKADQDLAKYRLPAPLTDFYGARKDVFLKLRDIRDSILHHGYSPDYIYRLEDGFAIRIDEGLGQRLGDLNLWPDRSLKPNRLGSLLAVLEFLVRDMFDAMNQLGGAFVRCFRDPPPPLANGYQLFSRSPVSRHLACLDKYREEQWFDPKVVLGMTHLPGNRDG